MRYEIVTAGTFEGISLTDARTHLKEPTNITVEDDLINSYIAAAGRTLEFKTNRVISSTTFAGYLDEWEEMITINRNPVTAVSSVQYYDGDNVLQTLPTTDYIVDTVGTPSRIYITEMPTIYTRPNAIKINFVAGYTSQNNVDERIKQFIRLIIADYKQTRTDYVTGTIISQLPRTVEYLLNQLRIDEL